MILYRIARFFVECYIRLTCRVHLTGRENIPGEGGFLLACNHRSSLDPFILGTCVRRPLYFMAKEELFNKSRVLSRLMHWIGAFPVRRGRGDTQALDTAVRLVEEGKIVAIFPEGTRVRGEHEMQRAKSGVAVIALRAGCGVLPCAVRYGPKGWRRRVYFSLGEMIPSAAAEETASHDVRRMARQVMDSINGMLLPS